MCRERVRLNTFNFAEKALIGGNMQPLKNVFPLTYHPAKMRPRLQAMSQERVRAYMRYHENASALTHNVVRPRYVVLFLDLCGPTA